SCGAMASKEEVQELTDQDTFEKYERFGRMQLDTQLRQCPLCGVLCKPAERADGEVVAEMRCAACASQFCYYHSNAHSGKPCEEYRLQVAKEERLAFRALASNIGAGSVATRSIALPGTTTQEIL
ncbi:unnamed protein product, partial [Polarella glacialis]